MQKAEEKILESIIYLHITEKNVNQCMVLHIALNRNTYT